MTDGGIRLAVYADINPNIIDGSSVWLMSITTLLSEDHETLVRLLLKAPITRDVLVRPLRGRSNVELVEPPENRTLTIDDGIERLLELDAEAPFDGIVMRGKQLCLQASRERAFHGRIWTYITDLPDFRSSELDNEPLRELARIAQASEYILCQTQWIEDDWNNFVPESRGKTIVLPPMIPHADAYDPPAPRDDTFRIVYAGKMAKLWATLDMLDAFAKAREVHPNIELHIFGDKIHHEPDFPTFRADVRQRCKETPGVVVRGGMTRQEVLKQLSRFDLAWAWRAPELDTSREISTKLLEYSLGGVPSITNRNPVNCDFFGEGYPFFLNKVSDFTSLVAEVACDHTLLVRTGRAVCARARAYTFDSIHRRVIRPALHHGRPRLSLVANGRWNAVVVTRSESLTNVMRALADDVQRRTGADVTLDIRPAFDGQALSAEAGDEADGPRPIDRLVVDADVAGDIDLGQVGGLAERVVVRLTDGSLCGRGEHDFEGIDYVVTNEYHVAGLANGSLNGHGSRLCVIPDAIDARMWFEPKNADAPDVIGIDGGLINLRSLPELVRLVHVAVAASPKARFQVNRRRSPDGPDTPEAGALLDELCAAAPRDRCEVVDVEDAQAVDWRALGFLVTSPDVAGSARWIGCAAVTGTIPILLGGHACGDPIVRQWCYRRVDGLHGVIARAAGGEHVRYSDRVRELAAQRFSRRAVLQTWADLLLP